MKINKNIENKYVYYSSALPKGIKGLMLKLYAKGMSWIYKPVLNIIRPHQNSTEEKKYDVVVGAIFKNEAKYLKEWIEFNRIVGVQHFYMYNNFSDDNYMEVLGPYIQEGIVDLIDWPVKQGQISAYKDCYDKHRKDAKWIGFIDIDEYIVPNKMESIYDFLKFFEKNRAAVIINWRIFGTSGHIEENMNETMVERYTVCWDKYCSIGKCFYNTKYDIDKDYKNNTGFHHTGWGKLKNMNLPPVNVFDKVSIFQMNYIKTNELPIQINHYFTKSFDEYVEKRAKGDVYYEVNPHDEEYFYAHEMRCRAVDYSAYKYLIKLKRKMGNI